MACAQPPRVELFNHLGQISNRAREAKTRRRRKVHARLFRNAFVSIFHFEIDTHLLDHYLCHLVRSTSHAIDHLRVGVATTQTKQATRTHQQHTIATVSLTIPDILALSSASQQQNDDHSKPSGSDHTNLEDSRGGTKAFNRHVP